MKLKMPARLALPALALGLGLITLAPLAVAAQGGGWVPFVALKVQQEYNLAGGKRVLLPWSERTGIYARDANGSIYSRTMLVFGPHAGEASPAVVQDRKTGFTYKIDYTEHQAVIVSQPPSGPPGKPLLAPTDASFHLRLSPDLFVGNKVVNGVKCEGWRTAPGSPMTGVVWHAPSLNYAGVLYKLVDSRMHVELDISLQDIQVGQAPDPRLFQVPAGFTVVGK